MTEHNEAWLQQVRAQLDQDVNGLDAHRASRLNRARQQALQQGLSKRRWFGWQLALASCAALALAVTLSWQMAQPAAPPVAIATPASDDFDLLAGTEELEMIENLEFYAWLEQQSLDG